MRIAIIGAGELGKAVVYHAVNDSGYEIVGFYDDFNEAADFDGYPLLGKPAAIIDDFGGGRFDNIFIAIGYAQMSARTRCYRQFAGKVPMANIIHSSSYVDSSCTIGEGVFIFPGCTLDFEAQLGDNVLLNTGVTIAHHSRVAANTFVAPGVTVAGLVDIGESCFIGVGSTILDCLKIGHNSTVGGGAVVIKDTRENSVSVGVPAWEIKIKPPLTV
jgi:sugar O-acyltransferase (sialic acid O-acetyltransferase NeuD family)